MSHHTGTEFRILPAQTREFIPYIIFAMKSQDIRARTATLRVCQRNEKGRITSRAEMKEKRGSSGCCIMATTTTTIEGKEGFMRCSRFCNIYQHSVLRFGVFSCTMAGRYQSLL